MSEKSIWQRGSFNSHRTDTKRLTQITQADEFGKAPALSMSDSQRPWRE